MYQSGPPQTHRIDGATTLAELVTRRPDLAPSLDRLGLDYCCGGARTLADACAAAGLDADATVAGLTAIEAAAPSEAPVAWAELGPSALADHIEITHHAYLRGELPRLGSLAERVESVHGDRHTELADVRRVFESLRADLEPHLVREEEVVFPLIREIDAAGRSRTRPSGPLHDPVEALHDDHEQVGELLTELRDLTDSFAVPDDGCASYRAFYDGLADLVADIHLHVHKENNVLFPSAAARERAVLAGLDG